MFYLSSTASNKNATCMYKSLDLNNKPGVFGFLRGDIKLGREGATVDPSAVRAERQMCPHYSIRHVGTSADVIMGC